MINYIPVGGTTGLSHDHSEAVILAAQWLADQQNPPHPVIAYIRQQFCLSALEACEAASMAQSFRSHLKARA